MHQTTDLATNYPAPGAEYLFPEAETEARADSVSGTSFEQLGGMLSDLMGLGTTIRTQGGLTVYQQANSMAGWVYVAVSRKRDAISRAVLRAFMAQPDGKKPVEVVDPRDDFLRVLQNPNPMDTRSEFWDQTSTFLDLTGNAIWLKVREKRTPNRKPGQGNKVRELWVLPSQFITPAHTRDKLLVGYWMETGLGEPILIPAEDIVHHKQFNTKDRFWGLGTLSAAADAMKADNAIAAAQLASFNNDLLATLYFTCEQALTDPQWKRMLSLLRERYAGYTKAGRPLLLENGMKCNPINRPPAEMAFRDSGLFTRDKILAIFGVPPLLAGVVENANNSNTASQERVFEAYTTAPRLVHIQERINKDLAPEFGPQYSAEFDDPVQQDRLAQAKIDTAETSSGVRSVNDIREREGLPPAPWGYGPRWWVELQEKLKAGVAISQGQDPGQTPPGNSGDTNQTEVDANGDPTSPRSVQVERPSSGNEPGRRSTTFADDNRVMIRKLIIRTVENDFTRLEGETVPTLRDFFAKQARRIQANLERVFGHNFPPKGTRTLLEDRRIFCVTAVGQVHARLFPDGTTLEEIGNGEHGHLGKFCIVPCCRYGDGEWSVVKIRGLPSDQIEQLDEWQKAAENLAERMRPRAEEAMRTGGQMQGDMLGHKAAFDLADEQAMGWLRAKDRDYWQNTVNATTKALLSEKLARVLSDEPTLDKLRAVVEEVMSGRIKSSSHTIARTETIGAYNAGADISRHNLGVQGKEWMATFDHKTRATHFVADGQTVAQASTFEVGGYRLRYPGDPEGPVREIVNCRCVAMAVVTDKFRG